MLIEPQLLSQNGKGRTVLPLSTFVLCPSSTSPTQTSIYPSSPSYTLFTPSHVQVCYGSHSGGFIWLKYFTRRSRWHMSLILSGVFGFTKTWHCYLVTISKLRMHERQDTSWSLVTSSTYKLWGLNNTDQHLMWHLVCNKHSVKVSCYSLYYFIFIFGKRRGLATNVHQGVKATVSVLEFTSSSPLKWFSPPVTCVSSFLQSEQTALKHLSGKVSSAASYG